MGFILARIGLAVYRRRPAFVEIYLRGRGNAAVARFGRDARRVRRDRAPAVSIMPSKLSATTMP